MKMRPSGAMAMAVGLVSPEALVVSEKPAGSVAAPATVVKQRCEGGDNAHSREGKQAFGHTASRLLRVQPHAPDRPRRHALRFAVRECAGRPFDRQRQRAGSVTITKVTANQVQGIAFKVLFDGGAISSMSFARTGAFAAETPLFETSMQGSGWFSYVVLFAAPANASGQIGLLTALPTAPAGTVIPLTLHPPSAMLSNQSATVVETVANGSLALVNGSITADALLGTPTGVDAVATGTQLVDVRWNAVASATHYEVWRSFDGGAYAFIGSPALPAITDESVIAGKAYLYRVRAVNAMQTSPFSSVDAATMIVFTDEPVVAQSTRVKAVHITQLRTAVNAMRASASLPPLTADPTIGSGLVIRAQHITAIRTGLSEARSAIGMPALSYTDGTLTTIKAIHVQELRNGVK
jgi:hypothetical protein